ncbi:exosortase C-terminal domain/associated protein EpsI [Desulfobacter curvatus]|uniref:exosortase C-terminal domain/associated protein EpsI n=1 Tax=Desulfobacter curvatus TaxID=2290 RepID=UPI000478185B|nr:exosortase C-terminal domain/associated protein EpsI [Desulfobacter curvatus]
MSLKHTAIIVILLISASGLTTLFSHSERTKPNRPFSQFPLRIGSWRGVTSQMDEQVFNILGVEDYIMANFSKGKGLRVNLYVGFYQSQSKGDLIHSPKNCMPGAGWNIVQSSAIPINLPKSGKTIKIARLLLNKDGQKQVVYYWFQSRGRIISSEYMQKIWLVVDSITKNRTDGSFVRLIASVITNETEAEVLLTQFADEVYPVLNQFIPN